MYFGRNLTALFALNIAGFILALIMLYLVIAFIKWKLFEKAGEKGWKALIPIYNQYTEFKLAWNTKWFWIRFLSIVTISIGSLIPLLGPMIIVLSMLVTLFITVFFYMQEAKAFSKEQSYSLGLMLFGPVFYAMLVLDDDAKYIGPQADPKEFSKVKKQMDQKQEAHKTTSDAIPV